MLRKTKMVVVLFLSLCLLVGASAPIYAQETKENNFIKLEDLDDELGVKFLEVTDEQLIYTFTEDGEEYKYIDNIIDESTVIAEKYVKKDGEYELYDEVKYEINNELCKISSNITGDTEFIKINDIKVISDKNFEEKSNSLQKGYNWQYQRTWLGSTRFRNMTIASIGIALGAIVGGPVGAVIAVATYLFDKNIKTVYFRQHTYKDLNSPKLRPTFKSSTYWFTNSARTIRTKPHNTVAIYKSSRVR